MRHRDLPSLNLLPTFEAAARLGSFKACARELHLTPSAVSQQMRALEEELGRELFIREGRNLRLSPAGTHYAREVRQTLSELAAASQRLRSRAERGAVRLNTLDFVAYEFLLPRLSCFRARFPDVDLRVESSVDLVDLSSSDVDLVVRVGGGPWPSTHTRLLGPITAAIVCSPSLARSLLALEDVFDVPLLELRGQEYRGWHAMAETHGRKARRARISVFETYFETMRAAEQGLGAAFGLFPLTSEWVRSGRLSIPFTNRVPLPGNVSVLTRPAEAERPLYVEITDWLQEQYASLKPIPDGRIVPARRTRR